MQEYIDCSFEIVLPKEDKTSQERRLHAQNLLIFYQEKASQDKKRDKSLQNQKRELANDEISNDRDIAEADLPSCEAKSLQDKDSLLILEGLSLGKSVNQIYKENKSMQYYPEEKLKNVPQLILLRLSKILIDLLPISPSPTPKQFKQKYFKNNQMLQYYHRQGLNLCPTFGDLLFISSWQKISKEYLMRGYSHDYLPEDIKKRLDPIASVFNQIKQIHSNYQHFLETRQKLKANRNIFSSHRDKRLSTIILQSTMQP